MCKKSPLPESPELAKLDSIDKPFSNLDYSIRLSAPEFTTLCPITSQPDFGQIILDYIPKKLILESKSFKLFLFSFRNYCGFHEDCTVKIAKKVMHSIKPKWLRVAGIWNPRGGIPIDVFFQTGNPPPGVYIEKLNIKIYKGR